MNKKICTRILVALLALVMIIGLLPVATMAEDAATTKTYVLDAGDIAAFDKNVKADCEEEVVNDYFTCYWATNTEVNASGKTFSDGYVSTQRINFGGRAQVSDSGYKHCIKITTSGAATVKVWWFSAGAGRYPAVFDSEMNVVSAAAEQNVASGEEAISTMEIAEAGTYYIGNVTNKNYFYKVEVTEVVASTGESGGESGGESSGEAAKAWVEVDAADLEDGDIIAITSDDAGDINYLLNASTTSTTTSRPSADVVTLTDGKLTDVDAVYQLTVEMADGGFYLKNAEGVYMTWTSGTTVNFTGTAQNAALVHWDSAAGAQGMLYTSADANYPARYICAFQSTAVGNPVSWRAYHANQSTNYENEAVTIWRYQEDTGIETVTIRAQVPASWAAVNVHAWVDQGGDITAWPGASMSLKGEWYTAKIENTANRIIINNGTEQTADLQIEAGKNVWVIVDGGNNATVLYEEPGTVAIHAKVPADWTAANLWAWSNANTNAYAEWPGAAMTADGEWYTITAPSWIANVIINNGSAQTADIAVDGSKEMWITVADDLSATVDYEKPTTGSGFPAAGTEYYLGVKHGGNNDMEMFFNGQNSNAAYRMALVEAYKTEPNGAVKVILEETTGGYNLYFMDGTAKKYIIPVKSGTYNNINISDTASGVWTWNEEYQVLVANIEGTDCIMAASGTYLNFEAKKLSQIASLYPMKLYTELPTKAEQGGESGGEIAVSPIADVLAGNKGDKYAIKGEITFIDGKTVYIEDATGAIAIYLSAANDEWKIGGTVEAEGTLDIYNSLPELKNLSKSEYTAGTATIQPTKGGISVYADSNLCHLITLEGQFTVSSVSESSSGNVTVVLVDADGNEITLFKPAKALEEGDVVASITGVLSTYNKLQIRTDEQSDIVMYVPDDNTGDDNTGDNTGDDNTGDDNTGDNTGDDNTGDDNTGDDNTGDDNTGDDNTGDNNTGDNTGDDNTGDNTNPDNGDNSLIFVMVGFASLMAMAAVVVVGKKQIF